MEEVASVTVAGNLMSPFSEYVSLGINCEGAFQFRRVLGRDASSFFSWNVTPLPSLLAILQKNFNGLLNWDSISVNDVDDLLFDPLYEYSFHSPFRVRSNVGQDKSQDVLRSEFEEKVRYLIEKFTRPRQSDENTLYIYKYEGELPPADVRTIADDVISQLRAYHESASFQFVLLQHESRREQDWGNPVLRNRYLKRFAPWQDATDGHVMSWDNLFREFPHRASMRLANY